tara:strand:+ start:265 stop:525 length:261 start_codon:yes stop_codon:yes gene_type:complete
MAESDQGPPRLPDPPPQDSPFGYTPYSSYNPIANVGATTEINFFVQQQNKNNQYLQDLVRALQFYIAQEQRNEIAENSQTINWFLS